MDRRAAVAAGGGPVTSAGGTPFGRYRLLREIGRGGEATVHLAEDPVLDRRVAIKIFPLALRPGEVGLPAGFRQEVEVLSRLRHPGISAIHDAGVEDGCAFIAMAYAEGGTLADAGAIAQRDAVRIAADVAATLTAAHEAGVVHGDLKPANVLVTPEGRAVVLDFGVARLLDASDARPARRAGTLPYLAPERLHEPPGIGSDVFGLGAILFELVAGTPPWTAPTRAALVREIADVEPPLLRGLVPSASRDLEAVVAKALARDRTRRYPSMAAFEADLRRAFDGEPVWARRHGPLARATRWAKRHKAAAAVIAFGIVFLATAATVAGFKNRDLRAYLENARLAEARATSDLRGAEESNVRYERLARRRRLEDLESRAAALVPPTSAILPALEAWRTEAQVLAAEIPRHREELEEVRARGTRRTTDAENRSRGLAREIETLRARLPAVAGTPGAGRALGALIGTLETRLPPPVEHWTYPSEADAWHDDVLSSLVGGLERFADPGRFVGGMADVARRVDDVRALDQVLADSAAAWDRARRSIADRAECPRYQGLEIRPQPGLVPLRRDPVSGLWEFQHVLSGAAPGAKGAGAPWAIGAATGIVMVLLPGGTARMGARRPAAGEDATAPHVDAMASPEEAPLDDVPLSPFFISKYEMTEAQWARVRGVLPVPQGAGGARPETRAATAVPVVSVNWFEARSALARVGLELPTEAQWEYAARAGTTTPWWTGSDVALLPSAAVFETDAPAPVGSWAPNAFGLHDTAGNVSEWCLDVYARYEDPRLPGTGERRGLHESEHRIRRGGSFRHPPNELRSARRAMEAPDVPQPGTGVRPARQVQ